jgi:prophage tail gpP-like protein
MDMDAKSVLAAATEGSANPQIFKKNQADIPVENLILEVLLPFGFDTIVSDNAGHAKVLSGKQIDTKVTAITAQELKTKDAAVQENETAYAYIARLVTRLGVILRVNFEGKLLLSAPNYDQDSLYTIVEGKSRETKGDRAISMVLDETNRGQFSEYVVRGKGAESRGKKQTGQPIGGLQSSELTGRFATEAEETQASDAFDSFSSEQPFRNLQFDEIDSSQPLYTSRFQPYKPKFFLDKRSRDNDRCKSFCKLLSAKNSPQAFQITAVVDGIRSTSGAIWTVDTTCRVKSESLDIDEIFWILETNMEVSKETQRTTVKLIPLRSLIIGDIPR